VIYIQYEDMSHFTHNVHDKPGNVQALNYQQVAQIHLLSVASGDANTIPLTASDASSLHEVTIFGKSTF
jgi:hypothetical protein